MRLLLQNVDKKAPEDHVFARTIYSVRQIKVNTPMREHGPCVDRVFKTKHGPQPIANLFSSSSLTTLVFTASCVSQKISAKILKTCQKSFYPGIIRLINKFLTVGGL
jgi:hypothetical protein